MTTKAEGATDEQRETREEFERLVNMTPKTLRKWLDSDEAQAVGQKPDGADESIGHASGRRIVELLEKKRADYDDDDYQHMRRVTGYIKRHLAQRPDGDVAGTPWRASLMNWGHDPLK